MPEFYFFAYEHRYHVLLLSAEHFTQERVIGLGKVENKKLFTPRPHTCRQTFWKEEEEIAQN